MQVDTHCKIGRVKWKRHSTATRLPNKALRKAAQLAAEVAAGVRPVYEIVRRK